MFPHTLITSSVNCWIATYLNGCSWRKHLTSALYECRHVVFYTLTASFSAICLLMTNQKHISTVVDFPDNVSEIVIIAKIP